MADEPPTKKQKTTHEENSERSESLMELTIDRVDTPELDELLEEILNNFKEVEPGTSSQTNNSQNNTSGEQFMDGPTSEGNCRWMGKFREEMSRRPFILHRILRCRNKREISDILKELEKRVSRYMGQILWVSVHDTSGWEHIHTVHDCSFNKKQCRCGILAGFDVAKPNDNANIATYNVTDERLHALYEYLHKRPRSFRYVYGTETRRDRLFYPPACNSTTCGYKSENRQIAVLDACEARAEIFRERNRNNRNFSEVSGTNEHSDETDNGGSRSAPRTTKIFIY
ncbi:uncharacterized protein LOC123295914 [Chrysoperla carnea]|uniref:uncharacterized protein LOC123295914 n=1 Tax=Chrysoperla carnea TaxID=189513 RepID=UPI001D05ED91|nr:uncharacterized protein LOC123295914 [Chrysoperla carnea]